VQDALGKNIKLRLQLCQQILPVQGDRGQLEQVFLNLVVNARDAMPNGGTLTISTENSKESGVLLRFSDTGVGMSAATKARIFDPFFTTKSAGVGTGLGLSTVYGIIGQSGGKVAVKSELGQGTEFEIYLPRAPQLALVEPGITYPRRPEQNETTILLVEDEADLRDLLSRILQDNHYQVLEAEDGEQALRVANRSPTRIDLVLTDLIMPGLSGYDVAQKIRAIRPGIKIMYITGYVDGKKQSHRLQRDERLLQKPVHPEQLLSSVREMLSASPELGKAR
jgi:CheY-like chemotaxis protein